MTSSPFDGHLHLVRHPFVADRLTHMRHIETPSALFRQHLQHISTLLAYEALADTPLETRVVETPLQLSKQPCLPDLKPALVSVLRAGNAMVDGALALSPHSPVGMIGLQRNEETLAPKDYFLRLPQHLGARLVLVCDPMVATGGSLVRALDLIQHAGATQVRVLCLLAAPEGVERVLTAHPDVHIWAAALDDHLNEKGYIVPGLGDAGDRIYAA